MIITPHWPVPLGHKPIDLGLERIKKLLEKLGNPHKHLPPVIHIAGTNGKGSTLAFIKTLLKTAGYRVHSYVSPHLVCFNERIMLNGEPISDAYLVEVLDRCKAASEDVPITFFEGTTAAAFLAFSEVEADVVLLETGLGGRLDATNVIDKPALTVITPISIDHVEFLGDTIAAIAAEKAAIMKPKVPCVVGKQSQEAFAVIKEVAGEKSSPLCFYGDDWQVLPSASGFSYTDESGVSAFPVPSLFGAHQIDNASIAIAAVRQLEGFSVTDDHITTALTQTQHFARLQPLKQGALVDILPTGSELWLDGGHNAEAGHILAQALASWDDKPLYVICGMLQGKDSQGFLAPLAGLVTELVAIPIPEEENSLPAEDLNMVAKQLGIPSVTAKNLSSALEYCAGRFVKPSRILICGSLYLAGHVLTVNTA